MNKIIFFGVLSFCIGLGVGYVVFSSYKPEGQIMNHTSASMHSMHGKHAMIEVDTSKSVPTISIEAIPDSKDGYNLRVVTKNYTFTPEKVGNAPVPNQGHAHIYVNDAKIARLYGEWFNISSSALKDGSNVIEVTLNADDHSEWVINGKHISDTVTVWKSK